MTRGRRRRTNRSPRRRSLAANGPENERAYIEALAVRYSADPKADRAALARAFSQAMGDLSQTYPDDLDAAVIYAESLMNLTPWKLWTLDGKPAREHRADRQRARVGAAAESESPRREPLLHSRRRGVAHAGTRAAERAASRQARRIIRPPAAHAGAHLCAHRRPRRRRRRERGGRRRRSPLPRDAHRRTGCTE